MRETSNTEALPEPRNEWQKYEFSLSILEHLAAREAHR